jgi:hypothetical protein
MQGIRRYFCSRYFGSMLVVAALGMPIARKAMSGPQEDHDRKNRVYDREHKDYHNWDENENRAWIRFNTENHREAHEFAKANRKEQAEYWDWRHAHPEEH